MKTVKDFNVKNKKVLVRCDFNVPLDNGSIKDDFRIKQTIPTIEYLIENNAKVILMSHLGSPKGIDKDLKMDPIQKKLSQYLKQDVFKTSECIGKKVKKAISNNQVVLLENLRFYKEEENNDKFSKELAALADIYINDAFGVSHRKHASVVGVPKHIPSGAGLLLEKEVNILSKVLEKPCRPLVVIVGGAKASSKIKVIKQLQKTADYVLIGGKIANTILIVQGVIAGKSWPSEDTVKEIKELDITPDNLYMPLDNLISSDESGKTYVRESVMDRGKKDEFVFVIGPETIKLFSKIIKQAKMIVWAGPMGLFENPLFEIGTRKIAEEIVSNHKAHKIVGGGDTIFAVSKFGLRDKFDHVSTGGGAMLDFLSGEELPGLKALENEI